MKKISIIIPVYNVEKYIKKCINSALNQNLNSNEYEIIVVDDESPDNSVTIIKELMLNNSQISLYSQKNKGLGGARNTGITNATGKYILFLDADDNLVENSLNTIINYSISNNLDILEFGANGTNENGDILYTKSKNTSKISNGYTYLSKNQYMNSACNKLYSLEFIKRNNLLFKERIFIEDFEFNTRAYYFANRVIGINTIVANFVQTSNSITRNNNPQKNKKMIFDIKNVIDLTIVFAKSIPKEEVSNLKIINERISFLSSTILYLIFKLNINKKVRLEIINALKKIELYPNKVKINDPKKNIFRVLVNNNLFYNNLCNFKNKINSY